MSRVISVRVTDEEYAQIKRDADAARVDGRPMKVSQLMRKRSLRKTQLKPVWSMTANSGWPTSTTINWVYVNI